MDIAMRAAIAAGKEILSIYNHPSADFSIEKKEDNSPLTEADKAAHRIIMQHLKTSPFPVLSEEGKSIPYETRRQWDTYWLVDPLDGTREFISRNGEFTVNIALVQHGRPLAGVVYIPVTRTLYAGEVGEGAWKITVTEKVPVFDEIKQTGQRLPCVALPQQYTVVASRSHRNPETETYLTKLKQEHPELEIISRGSALKICQVAEGAAHEYPRFGPTMEWDTAAGHAIANAAGKKLWLSDQSGELTYNKRQLVNPAFIVK